MNATTPTNLSSPTPQHTDGGRYEFGDPENEVIAHTARRAGTWGSVSLVLGLLQMLAGFTQLNQPGTALGSILRGAVAIIVGVIFRKVGDSFKRVVDTRGDDIGNLMEALRGLSSAFQTQIVAVGVAVGVGLLLVLVGS
jgi:hypothetical protein